MYGSDGVNGLVVCCNKCSKIYSGQTVVKLREAGRFGRQGLKYPSSSIRQSQISGGIKKKAKA